MEEQVVDELRIRAKRIYEYKGNIVVEIDYFSKAEIETKSGKKIIVVSQT